MRSGHKLFSGGEGEMGKNSYLYEDNAEEVLPDVISLIKTKSLLTTERKLLKIVQSFGKRVSRKL
jgi:hypothetical protein